MDADQLNRVGTGLLPALLGIEIVEVGQGRVTSRLEVRPELLAPNGFLHAATIVGLADTSCGYGTIAGLPEGAESFTTVDLSTSFSGTAREGAIGCEATLDHAGRTIQIWGARVLDEGSGRLIALFRCTQLVLYPR